MGCGRCLGLPAEPAESADGPSVEKLCDGLDPDADLLRSAYLPGAVDDHGVFVGDAAEFCERVLESHRRYDATMHCVLNHLVELDGPDGARGGNATDQQPVPGPDRRGHRRTAHPGHRPRADQRCCRCPGRPARSVVPDHRE